MTIYIIGTGGTGAKCVEALTRLASVGLFPDQPIKTLFVDADETNGNLERARSSLNIYDKCYRLVSSGDKDQCPWMKTKIESFDLWSPFTGLNLNKDLKSFFNYNTIKQNQPALGNLFDILYTKDEQQVSLDVGFRGRPAIGAAVMSQVDLDRLDREPWGTLIKNIQSDVSAGKAPKVFLCGSIFGGTGASGLPTIGRLIANKLNRLNIKEKIKIGCLFLLPYFGFSTPPGEDTDGVYARSEQFLLNTEAALRYYVTQAQETFDTVYLLGNENLSRVKFSIGKNSQRNEAHFLEAYAGLAARHFWLHTPTVENRVVLIGRDRIGRLTWNDLPERVEIQPALVNGARFAYTWLAEINPELTEIMNRGNEAVLAPWLLKFFPKSSRRGNDKVQLSDLQQQDAIKIISNWCQDYLRWLYDIHQCEGEQIQFFVPNTFENPEGKLRQEQLAELVFKDNPDRRSKARDTIHNLKKKLQSYRQDTAANVGVVGLARTLYVLCKQ
ncbi:MAG: tubulin-like doman-containing protein [Prochloraceae cyanobacterium]|nr:tubulin-like doman-containing protein [Prochloraceae cyanobacterium]